MQITNDSLEIVSPLLSDRLSAGSGLPERVRVNGDHVEWQYGAGRGHATEPERRHMARCGRDWSTYSAAKLRVAQESGRRAARQRPAIRLNEFLGLCERPDEDSFREAVRGFVWNWGPLACYPERVTPTPLDDWSAPSEGYRKLQEATERDTATPLIYRERLDVYREYSDMASGCLKVAGTLRRGHPIREVGDAPTAFRNLRDIGGRAVFTSDAISAQQECEDAQWQFDWVYQYVNWWIASSGVHPQIGWSFDGSSYVGAIWNARGWTGAWDAAHQAGSPLKWPRWNPETRQTEDVPVPRPSKLSGQLASDVASVVIGRDAWELCACGNLFERYGRAKYCSEGCPKKIDARRKQLREAQATSRKKDQSAKNMAGKAQ